MKIPFVDLKSQYREISDQIDQAIQSVIQEAAFIKGPYVEKFEQEFASFLGLPNCLGVANGTDAIEIALASLGVGTGDEVLVPAHTWISTAEAVTSLGAKVVFVDTLASSYTIDVAEAKKKLSHRTKAMIAVHLYGHPCEIEELTKFCTANNLYLIEDCAQAHAAKYKNQMVGSFGQLATFSFFPGKNLGAYGDAGCIVGSDSKLMQRCRMIANHGRLSKFDHALEGRNSRLDGLQAAILSVKLPYLEKWTELRRAHASQYRRELSDTPLVLPTELPDTRHVYHLFVVQSDNRDSLRAYLEQNQVSTGIHYPEALPFLSAYSRFGHIPQEFPNAYQSVRRILSLPMYPELSSDSISRVSQLVLSWLDSETRMAANS